MSLAALRDSIRAAKDVTYLNTGYTAPSPETVLRRVREVLEKEAAVGPASVEGLAQYWQIGKEAREAVASLLNCEADQIAITHGTTEGLNVVIYGLPWKPGDEFVTTNIEHPALAIPAQVLEQRYGVIVRRIELRGDESGEEMLSTFKAALTANTKLVALSHIQFSCGLRMPAKQMVAAAHEAGALIALDGAQTGGQVAIDVRELDADFYAISGQKWMMGPNGTGALYVKPEHLRKLEPLFMTNAVADGLAAANYPGSELPTWRFRITTQSPALSAGFTAAIRLVQDLGLEAIEQHCISLSDRLREGVKSIRGCMVTGPASGETRCGLAAVAFDGWTPEEMVAALWSRYRIAARTVPNPAAVRFSTAAFNTRDEVDKALEALSVLAGERS